MPQCRRAVDQPHCIKSSTLGKYMDKIYSAKGSWPRLENDLVSSFKSASIFLPANLATTTRWDSSSKHAVFPFFVAEAGCFRFIEDHQCMYISMSCLYIFDMGLGNDCDDCKLPSRSWTWLIFACPLSSPEFPSTMSSVSTLTRLEARTISLCRLAYNMRRNPSSASSRSEENPTPHLAEALAQHPSGFIISLIPRHGACDANGRSSFA